MVTAMSRQWNETGENSACFFFGRFNTLPLILRSVVGFGHTWVSRGHKESQQQPTKQSVCAVTVRLERQIKTES